MKKITRIIIVSVAVLTAGTAVAFNIPKEEEKVQEPVNSVQAKKEAPVEPEKVEEAPVEVQAVEVAQVAEVPVEVVEPPRVQTIQEYAMTQLDMASPENQACFEAIVATYPDRFVGEQAQANVRALKAYASVCSSGVQNKLTGNILLWDKMNGVHGAFFDSELAKQYH